MNQTSNYQLNQWQLHDRIQMQDFNADNAKIDAALKAEADARTAGDLWVKLKEQTLSADAPQIDINLSGIDLSQYRQLDLWLDPVLKSGGPDSFFIRVNNLTEGYYIGAQATGYMGQIDTGTEQSRFCFGCYHFYLTNSIAGTTDHARVTGSGMNGRFSEQFCGIELAPAKLHTINILGWKTGFTNVLKGTKVRIYGWKK